MTNDSSIESISVADVKRMLEAGTVQVIDVRPSFDFAGGRIPGARNLPIHSLTSRGDQLNNTGMLVFVSEDGVQGEEAARVARSLGFTEVANVHGGFDAWEEAEFPVHTIDDGS
jgi:rhodanese-related sulfurtransferase